jgi:hypothetical protein
MQEFGAGGVSLGVYGRKESLKDGRVVKSHLVRKKVDVGLTGERLGEERYSC